MNRLDSRLDKLEQKCPKVQRDWMKVVYEPRDDNAEFILAEARAKAEADSKNLIIVRIIEPPSRPHQAEN